MKRICCALTLLGSAICFAQQAPPSAPSSAPSLDASAKARLEKNRGVHPRLFLKAARMAQLRKVIKTTHAEMWKGATQQAGALTRNGPPAYREKTRTGPWDDGSRESWQAKVGVDMPRAAMAYLLSGEPKYLAAAREYALASCSYPTWGTGNLDGMDLVAGQQMFGLALVYDWCYRDLDAEARQTIRATLARRAKAMFERFAAGKFWSYDKYLQNHLWGSMNGLAAASLAIYDEEPDASQWLALAADKIKRSTDALGPDGASHEGMSYWGYGLHFLMPAMDLLHDALGQDLYDRPWWRNTAAYRLYLGLPRGAWSHDTVVNIADCGSRRPTEEYPVYELRRLAAEFGDGHSQWLAARLTECAEPRELDHWMNLLWYDPKVPEKPPGRLPTLRHFEDLGIVSARTDWLGKESLVVFKCGPCLGHAAMKRFDYDLGAGHVHPDAGHFVIFAEDEWQVIDDGYCRKLTSQHNALLIGGKGQVGEGGKWFDGDAALKAHCEPTVTQAKSTPGLDQIAGDATSAYPKEAGLKRWVRHVLFLKPDVVIVADDIELGAARDLELRFHTEKPAERGDDGAWQARGAKSVLRLEPLTPADVTVTFGKDAVDRREREAVDDQEKGEPNEIGGLRLSAHRGAWRNAVAISWAKTGARPPRVTLKPHGDEWVFSAGSRQATLDWRPGEGEKGGTKEHGTAR